MPLVAHDQLDIAFLLEHYEESLFGLDLLYWLKDVDSLLVATWNQIDVFIFMVDLVESNYPFLGVELHFL